MRVFSPPVPEASARVRFDARHLQQAVLGLLGHGHGEGESRALSHAAALGPDSASVRLDQPFADRQTQAGSSDPALPVASDRRGVLAEQAG